MTNRELISALSLEELNRGAAAERAVTSVYCCDLLSIVMGRAPADSAWVTVMGNMNVLAVAALADVSCVVVAEDMTPDINVIERASRQDICLLRSKEPVFETAKAIDALLRKSSDV